MNGATRACFGKVSAGLTEESGVIVLNAGFDGSTGADQADWDKMVSWMFQLGFEPYEDPVLFTDGGVEVYFCRPLLRHTVLSPAGGVAAVHV